MIRDIVDIRGYPVFCLNLIAGFIYIQYLLRVLYSLVSSKTNIRAQRQDDLPLDVIRFCAAFSSAWFSLGVLNLSQSIIPFKNERESSDCSRHRDGWFDINAIDRDRCGRSIDVTLTAVVRALSCSIAFLLKTKRWRPILVEPGSQSKMCSYIDSVVFSLSSGTIMWAWIYRPETLPRSYRFWISNIAHVDERLIEVLRQARRGQFAYGKATEGVDRPLEAMCEDYGLPKLLGDPEQTIPIPCELVHMGRGPSCHWHAIKRFREAFIMALKANLPLLILLKCISARRIKIQIIRKAMVDSVRASLFMGSFVSLMYYGICLARTLVGPRVFSTRKVTPQMWDSGLGVALGSMLCGWPIMLETKSRKQELSNFVLPRALATLLPRRYDRAQFWKERLAFSTSSAIILTLGHYQPSTIRGVAGRLIDTVLSA